MSALPPPNCFFLLSAIGWLELGNPREALEELKGIAPEFAEHPEVLEAAWWVQAEFKNWNAALDLARLMLKRAPERVSGWIHQAYALRRAEGGGLQAAWDALLPAHRQFPKEDIVPFNLACYAAQMGRLEEAWNWLHKAMEAAGDVNLIKQRGLADADLQPLWARLKEL